jgi:hypothetical protein
MLAALPPRPPMQESRTDMTLIRNCQTIFAPREINFTNVLVAGTKVVGLLSDSDAEVFANVLRPTGGKVIDAAGLIMTPGFIGWLVAWLLVAWLLVAWLSVV